jgi:hypothetical protein
VNGTNHYICYNTVVIIPCNEMSVNGGDSLSTQNETKAGISRDADYEENKKQRN